MPHGLIYLVCLEIIEEVIDEKKKMLENSLMLKMLSAPSESQSKKKCIKG